MNPADPPLVMRDTVVCLCGFADAASIVDSIESMVADVKEYVPGYRLKQAVQIEAVGREQPIWIPELGLSFSGLKVAVFLEVEGAGHFLPAYAGNLDIMTSAAQKAAERVAHQYL
jgi:acetaldehyde dehydrogenase